MRDIGKELFEDRINVLIGSQWPSLYVVIMSSNGIEAARVSFDTDEAINAFDIERWTDAMARKHYPNSKYAKSPPL